MDVFRITGLYDGAKIDEPGMYIFTEGVVWAWIKSHADDATGYCIPRALADSHELLQIDVERLEKRLDRIITIPPGLVEEDNQSLMEMERFGQPGKPAVEPTSGPTVVDLVALKNAGFESADIVDMVKGGVL
jgi:hypothetical protein